MERGVTKLPHISLFLPLRNRVPESPEGNFDVYGTTQHNLLLKMSRPGFNSEKKRKKQSTYFSVALGRFPTDSLYSIDNSLS